jgi:hypothetical protein
MIDITNCPPEVQTLKKHADELYAKANQARERGKIVPFMAASACACAYGIVSNWTNPPLRNGRKVSPPTMDAVERADYDVLDMTRQIVL